MKLGDSLGRSRRGRKKQRVPATPDATTEESGAADDTTAAQGHVATDHDAAGLTEEKREPGSGGASATPGGVSGPRWPGLFPRLTGRSLAASVVGLALVGWFFGYTVATRLVFPAPPPRTDLADVPDLRGLGIASATERLTGAGLDMGGVDSLQHPTVAAGVVLGQSPLPGQVATPDQSVRVTISMGPQMRSVPDVRRLDRERARVVLETSGFVVSYDTAEAEEPRGRVIDVSPSPDNVVALPAEVTIVVSTGPPVIAMPFLLGLEQSEAESVLDSLGLDIADVEEVFRFGRDQGVVVEQQPAADTELERGGRVRLKVGRRGLGAEQ